MPQAKKSAGLRRYTIPWGRGDLELLRSDALIEGGEWQFLTLLPHLVNPHNGLHTGITAAFFAGPVLGMDRSKKFTVRFQ